MIIDSPKTLRFLRIIHIKKKIVSLMRYGFDEDCSYCHLQKIVRELEKKKFVLVYKDEEHLRRNIIELTKKGELLAETAYKYVNLIEGIKK